MFLQKNVIFADKAHLFRKGNAEERPYGMAYAGQKRGVDAILVSFAWQSPNGFGLCARLTKRWLLGWGYEFPPSNVYTIAG